MEETENAAIIDNRKRKLKLIGLAIILLLAVIAALLWFLSRQPEETDVIPDEETPVTIPSGNLPSGQPSGQTGSVGTVDTGTVTETIQADQQTVLKRLAMAFAERYGSYSNQSDFENLLDLTALMSQDMAARTISYVEGARASQETEAEYSGVSTRALSVRIDRYVDGGSEATLTVDTQRRAKSDASGENVYYQSLTVDFVLIDGSWKVDSATWNQE